jgi:predicted nucleic acid-binding Zn ribbon protein
MSMKIKNCIVCGNEFESTYGREICSEQCKIIRKKEHDIKGNMRRKMGISGQLESKICPECGKEFEALNRKYCNTKCSNEARSKNRKQISTEFYIQNKESVIKRIKANKESNQK